MGCFGSWTLDAIKTSAIQLCGDRHLIECTSFGAYSNCNNNKARELVDSSHEYKHPGGIFIEVDG